MNVDQDTLVAYVLGLLSPKDEDEVTQHLRAHPDEAAWVKDSFEALATYALSNTPEALPEDAEAKLLARIQQAPADRVGVYKRQTGTAQTEQPGEAREAGEKEAEDAPPQIESQPGSQSGPWSVRTLWLGLATAAAVVVLAWLSVSGPRSEDAQIVSELETLCARQDGVCQTLTDSQSEPIGTLARRADNSVLVVFDAEPPPESVYQAWEIVGDTPRSLGTFDDRVVNIPAPLPAGSTFGVTLEPPGGSPQPTSTPIVLYPLPG